MHLDNENYIIFITALEAYKYKMLSFKLINELIFFQQYMNVTNMSESIRVQI